MATLSAMYNNQLGDLHDAFVQVDAKREVIMALGKLLVGYSLNDVYDIRLPTNTSTSAMESGSSGSAAKT
ncbi:hypothetical protein RRF57_008680 [Xylaria bambusicola]|uniref:Uncharacterized protein n=1 Tax=Xylaria bambusicola TaxID=326684 RepID=A0AAN7UVR0_9PEZI